jgi:DNA topoisomerase-1
MTGLSAKVFRTHYATTAVETKLNRTRVDPDAPEYVKKHAATMANLEAAKVCNHKRTIPKTWEQSLQKKKDRLKARRAKAKEKEKKIKLKTRETEEKYQERLTNYQLKLEEHKAKLEEYKEQLEEKRQQEKSTKGLEKRIASKRKAIRTQRERIKNLKVRHSERLEKLKIRLSTTKERDRNAIEKLKLQITAQAETRDYNLGTSMKSYVDPRIYYNWSKKVDYDWRKYYSKTLQSKFSWVEPEEQPTL